MDFFVCFMLAISWGLFGWNRQRTLNRSSRGSFDWPPRRTMSCRFGANSATPFKKWSSAWFVAHTIRILSDAEMASSFRTICKPTYDLPVPGGPWMSVICSAQPFRMDTSWASAKGVTFVGWSCLPSKMIPCWIGESVCFVNSWDKARYV